MAFPILFFDTEATDLTPGQICQLAYILETPDKVEAKNYFFSVDDMSPGSQEVHGFSMEQLAELSLGAYFEDQAREIADVFSKARLLVGHNVAADDRYLRVELERAGIKLKKIPTFCTMNYATGIMNMQRKVVTGRPKPPKLMELAEYYGITAQQAMEQIAALFDLPDSSAHDARFDTVLTWLCFKAAIEKGDLRGI
ncbi:MAG: 3'-5' exonuclease [Clostridiales bacterium]|nr:3'-5' exonuclease [Clostridiales bacterium]